MGTQGSRKWWALVAVILAVLAVGLDGTILSVAVPTLAVKLNASESDLQWFSSGYLLVLAAAMLPMGLLGDRFGRKKVLLVSLLLFAIGSAACAISTTPLQFIAARTVLGLAGAGIIVMALSALTVLFTEQERPRAVSIWAAANFLALPIGPIFGGWLLTNYWWGWVFLINVPVALLGLLATLVLVPETRASVRPGLDPWGVFTSTAGLVALTYGFIEAGRNGWTDVWALAPMGAGLVVLVAFFLWEGELGRRPGGQPLIDLALFRSASFTWSVVLMAVLVLAMTGVLFTMPQYFQGVLGTDAMGSGLRLLPLIGGLVVGVLPSNGIRHLLGGKLAVALGFALVAAGMFLGSHMQVDSTMSFIGLWMALIGLGLGITFSTAATQALSELSEARAGVGSAAMQALQKMGGPLGTAVLGSVLSTVYIGNLALGGLPPAITSVIKQSLFGGLAVAGRLHSAALLASVRDAFVQGMDASLLAGSGIAVVGLLLTLAFLPSRTAPTVSTGAGQDAAPVKEGTVAITG
ncbi:MAG TPA: MFS transporter [Ktedonobacterales bacterium]|nr:MFS transporter [Ktedonobacterales bacterium]